MAQGQRHLAARLEVKIDESININIGENIAAINQEWLLPEKTGDVKNSAARLEQIRLMNEYDFLAPVGFIGKKLGELFRQMMRIDNELLHTGSNQMIQSKCDQTFTEDRQQRLWNNIGKRSEPGSQPCSKHESGANARDHGRLATYRVVLPDVKSAVRRRLVFPALVGS